MIIRNDYKYILIIITHFKTATLENFNPKKNLEILECFHSIKNLLVYI